MRRAHHSSAALLVVALALAACAPDVEVGGWTITVDTLNAGAGPVHVVNAPPAGGEDAITWRFEEEVRIGDVDGPMTFGRVEQIAMDTQGRIAAIDASAQELRLFSPDGEFLWTLGGPGEGPGELEEAFGVIAAGDRFLVTDPGNARLSIFTADSGFVTTHPTFFGITSATGWDAAVDTAGRIHVLSAGWDEATNSGTNMVRVYDDQMTELDTIHTRTYEEVARRLAGWSWEIPFGRGTMYVYVPFFAGQYEALDRTGAIWFAEAPLSYRLKRYLPGGDTLRVVELGRAARPIPPAARDSAIDAVRGQLQEQGLPPDLDWSLVPEVYAPIQGVSLSEDGDLWVRTSPSDESPTRYDVLDSEGRYRGTAEIPGRVKRGVEPVVRGDRFWAVVVGDLDEESIVGGRLVEAAPQT